MYTQHPQFHQMSPQFYMNQNYGYMPQQFPPVIYSNRKLQHINCVIPESQQAGGLFIGDTISTLKRQILINNNIQAILCCNAQAASNIYSIQLPIDFQYIDIQDHVQYPIKIHFQQAISFIQAKLKSKKNVLVQCHAGASRSATIIAAYLIKSKSWTHEQALQFLKEKRHRVKPNFGFLKQLQEYSLIMNKEKQKQNKNQKQKSEQKIKFVQKDKVKEEQANFRTPTKIKKDQIDGINSANIKQVQSQRIQRKISEIRSQQHTPDKFKNIHNKIDSNIFKFNSQRKNVQTSLPKKSFDSFYEQKQKPNLRHSIAGGDTELPYMLFSNENKKILSKTQQSFPSTQLRQQAPFVNYNNPIYYSPQNSYQNNLYYSPQPIKLAPEYYVYNPANNYLDQQYQSNGYNVANQSYNNGFLGSRGAY